MAGWTRYAPPPLSRSPPVAPLHSPSRGGLIPPWGPDYNPADYEKVAGDMSVRQRGTALLLPGDDGEIASERRPDSGPPWERDRPLDD
jgi:hypothetical protein